jgi:hypothetical protein
MTNNKQQGAVEWLEEMYNSRPAYEEFISYEEFEQAKEMEKEEKLKLIKFTSEIFELGKSHFSYALITNEEILELYNETNETNNERNSE